MEAGGDRFGRRPQGGSTSGSTDRFSCDILDCHAHSGRLEEIGDLNVSPHNGRSVLASDGRTLMVAEWGDADGFPVFWLHGSPGSRFSRHHDVSEYSRAGARVITYDRPGYGGSDRDAGRRVVSASEMLPRSPTRLASSGSPSWAAPAVARVR